MKTNNFVQWDPDESRRLMMNELPIVEVKERIKDIVKLECKGKYLYPAQKELYERIYNRARAAGHYGPTLRQVNEWIRTLSREADIPEIVTVSGKEYTTGPVPALKYQTASMVARDPEPVFSEQHTKRKGLPTLASFIRAVMGDTSKQMTRDMMDEIIRRAIAAGYKPEFATKQKIMSNKHAIAVADRKHPRPDAILDRTFEIDEFRERIEMAVKQITAAFGELAERLAMSDRELKEMRSALAILEPYFRKNEGRFPKP